MIPDEPQWLFATPLWRITDLPRTRAALSRIAAAVERDWEAGLIGSHLNRSNVLGGQSQRWRLADCPYLEAPERQELLGAIAFTARLSKGFKIRIWVNCGRGQAFNRAHVHPGSDLSGVLHVQVPEGSGELVFHDPRPQCAMAQLNRKLALHGEALRPEHSVMPEAGTLLLFPAWLMHEVMASPACTGLRIALSINISGLAG